MWSKSNSESSVRISFRFFPVPEKIAGTTPSEKLRSKFELRGFFPPVENSGFSCFRSKPDRRHFARRRGEQIQRTRRSGQRVKETADRLGFSSPFYFSRVFRAVYGVPPSRV